MRKIQIIFVMIAAVFFGWCSVSYAARVFVESESSADRGGIAVRVLIDTEGESINAVEGEVVYPPELVRLVAIDDSHSIVPLWMRKEDAGSGKFLFSGVIPNGFREVLAPLGEQEGEGELFTLVFQPVSAGEGVISVSGVSVLANDGRGTPLLTSVSPFPFSVSEDDIARSRVSAAEPDTTPPEPFTIELSRDDALFDGRYFISFNAHDKESGIFYYEVKEGWREFRVAESPFELANQKLYEDITVRAFDKAGNIREAALSAKNNPPLYLSWWLWFGILVVSICVWHILRKRL